MHYESTAVMSIVEAGRSRAIYKSFWNEEWYCRIGKSLRRGIDYKTVLCHAGSVVYQVDCFVPGICFHTTAHYTYLR